MTLSRIKELLPLAYAMGARTLREALETLAYFDWNENTLRENLYYRNHGDRNA